MKNKLKNTYHGTYGNIKRKKNNIMVYFEGYSTDKSYPKKKFYQTKNHDCIREIGVYNCGYWEYLKLSLGFN